MKPTMILHLCFVLLAAAYGEGKLEREEDVKELAVQVKSLTAAMADMMRYMNTIREEIFELKARQPSKNPADNNVLESYALYGEIDESKIMNDTDLEERVALLEFQMSSVQDDVSAMATDVADLEAEVTDLEEDVETQVTVLFEGQVIQDDRLLELENGMESVAVALVGVDDSINSLEMTDSALNASIVVLDSRVMVLEELNTTVRNILGSVEDLEQTDVQLMSQIDELDGRLGQLEINGTVAFHAFLGEYTTIAVESVIIFPHIMENIGSGYNGATGEFTVPSGGDGLYYLYVHFMYEVGKWAISDVRHNGSIVCSAYEDEENGGDYGGSSCGAVVTLQEGDVVHVWYRDGHDDFPFYSSTTPFCSFSGFRVSPV